MEDDKKKKSICSLTIKYLYKISVIQRSQTQEKICNSANFDVDPWPAR